jgi:hypothetical protein
MATFRTHVLLVLDMQVGEAVVGAPVLILKKLQKEDVNALAVNRTRSWPMATANFTIKPLVLLLLSWRLITFYEIFGKL